MEFARPFTRNEREYIRERNRLNAQYRSERRQASASRGPLQMVGNVAGIAGAAIGAAGSVGLVGGAHSEAVQAALAALAKIGKHVSEEDLAQLDSEGITDELTIMAEVGAYFQIAHKVRVYVPPRDGESLTFPWWACTEVHRLRSVVDRPAPPVRILGDAAIRPLREARAKRRERRRPVPCIHCGGPEHCPTPRGPEHAEGQAGEDQEDAIRLFSLRHLGSCPPHLGRLSSAQFPVPGRDSVHASPCVDRFDVLVYVPFSL